VLEEETPMSPLLGTNRRKQQDGGPQHDDVREDLISIAMDGFLPMAALSAVCLVGAMALVAAYYQDEWMWKATEMTLVISVVRVGVVWGFARKSKQGRTEDFLFWASAFSMATIAFCSMMALVTIYNFRMHDDAVQMLCVIGSFTLCSGISSRIGLHPKVSQGCIVMMQGALAYSLLNSPHPILRLTAVLSLVTAFTYCVSIHNQYHVIDEQVRTRRRLRNLANHDSLTGLPNRHLFDATFEKVCAERSPFTLWMLDLDDFKTVNDTWGHAVGDELLRLVARRLERTVRTGDLLARLGGDEFVILQPKTHLREATERMAERITAEISAPYAVDGHRLQIGVSMGIKLAAEGELSPHAALREADRALYRVKDLGQGGFEVV
jgi:diguanylate cyclase (GGDEF)-like protein